MRVSNLFRHFQMMQRTLSASHDPDTDFALQKRALAAEFLREVETLDDLNLKCLCELLGHQLEHELIHAPEPRRRSVVTALLKVVEDVEHQRHLR